MTVHLYIGREFDHTHEMQALRQFVGEMQGRFGASDQYFFILANYFIGDQEIDLAVLKKNAITIIELKECGGNPISGFENGQWLIHEPDGTEKVMNPGRENPYLQVRKYRFAMINLLADRSSAFLTEQKASQMNFGHVSAFIALSPALHPSSDIDMGYKPWFRVVGFDELCDAVYDQRSPALSFSKDELTALAEDVLRLTQADVERFLGAGALAPPAPLEQSETVVSGEQWKAYCRALVDEHKDWTELLVLPLKALSFVPTKLTPAEDTGPLSVVSTFHETTSMLQRSPITLEACVRSTKGPLIIVGDAGQGKTAALELLAITYSRRVVEGVGEEVPILVKLGRYDQQKRDLLSLITMSLRARGMQLERHQVEHLLGNASAPLLFMLDGLDEVRTSGRLGIKQDIESLLLSYPSHRAIITCRTADYDDFGLQLEGKERWELCRLEEQDVLRFLIDYYWTVEGTSHKGRRLFEQLREQCLLNFAQIPLHLGLIIGLAQQRETLPKNKGQLYQQFIEMVLRLEVAKGKAPPDWAQIERFLAQLAFVMREGETPLMSRRAARQAVGHYWQELWESGACSLRLDHVLDRTWNNRLMVKTDGEVGFRHSVLQDYFAAKRLEYMLEEGEEALIRYVGDTHWDEAFALLAGMVDDASQLVEFISRRASPLLTLKCLANASRLNEFAEMMAVERLLDQLFAPDILARQFTRLFSQVPAVLSSAPEFSAYLAPIWIGRLLSGKSISQEMILLCGVCLGQFAEQSLITALDSSDSEEERVRAAFLLRYLGGQRCVDPLTDCLYDENPDLRYFAVEALGRWGGPAVIDALKSRLSDTDSDVREVTITVLGALCSADVSPVPTTYLEGVMALRSSQMVDSSVAEEVKQWLRLTLADPVDSVRAEAVVVLGCLGEPQMTDDLLSLLRDTAFEYHQKGRVVRALGHVEGEQAFLGIEEFRWAMPEIAPAWDAPHVQHWTSPISFEVSAATSQGNSGPLLQIIALWRAEGFSDAVEEAGLEGVSILGYRTDRLRWYRERHVPAIIERGVDALDDLFECIAATNDGCYTEAVKQEATYLLERIRKSADVDALIECLSEVAHCRTTMEPVARIRDVEKVLYLVGEHCASWIPAAQDPLLKALAEDDSLAELLTDVYHQSSWEYARHVAGRAMAHHMRLLGRETEAGAKIYREIIEPWLREWEADEDQDLFPRSLILSLCGDSQAVPLLVRSLEAPDLEVRYRAAYSLLEYFADERGIGIMIDALYHGDDNWRILAAGVLEEFDDPGVTAAFARALHDPESYVRRTAIKALAKTGDQSVVGALVPALDDEDFWSRRQVIESLGKLGGQQAAEALRDLVSYHMDEHMRCLAVEALAAIGDPSALEAFRRALADGDPSVRSAASSGLDSWARSESCVESLRRIYSVMQEDTRSGAEGDRVRLVSRLWSIGTPEAIRATEDALRDPNELVRLCAIIGLDAYGTMASVPALSRVVEEDTGMLQETSLADSAREAIEAIQERSNGQYERQNS